MSKPEKEAGNKKEKKQKENTEETSGDEGSDHENSVDELAALGSLPRAVLKRVMGLRKLHESMGTVDEEYRAERIQLEIKYRAKKQPFYEDRKKVVAGEKELDDVELSAEVAETAQEDKDEKGIPSFWLQVLGNHPLTGELITEDDIPALSCLEDIRCEYDETYTTFTLFFEFKENEFFTNKVLEKSYTLSPDLLDEKAPSLVDSSSTPIEWKAGKNLCMQEIKKKQKAKSGRNKGQVRTVVREVPKPSFFHYFSEPKSAEDEEEEEDKAEEDSEPRTQLTEEEDFEIAHAIRTYLLPDAILWYTGEARDDDDFMYDEDEDDEDGEEDGEEEDDDVDAEAVDEDEARPGQGKGGKVKGGKGGKEGKGFAAPAAGTSGSEQPECKQN